MAEKQPITPSAQKVEQPSIPQIRTFQDDLARAKGNAPKTHNLSKPGQLSAQESLTDTVKAAEQQIDDREKAITERRKKMSELRGKPPVPQKKKSGYRPYSTVINRAGSQSLAFDPPRSLEDLKSRPDYKPAPAHEKKKKKGGFFRLFSKEKKKEPENIIDTIIEEAPRKATKESQAPVKTYKDDLNRVIKDRKESVVSIALAEEKSRIRRAKPEPKTWPRTLLFTLATIVLLIGGGWITFIGYNAFQISNTLPEKENISGLFRTEFTQTIDIESLSAVRIRDLIFGENNPENGMTTIQITEKIINQRAEEADRIITGPELASTLVPKIPDVLLRTISDNGVMYGMHHNNGATNPFFVLKVDSFEQTLSQMLAWEQTLYTDTEMIMKEIDDFIKIKIVDKRDVPNAPEDAPDEITVEEVIPVDRTAFKDALIQNKDVRIIRNPFVGDPLFLYGFSDPNTLIITTSGTTFSEVSNRLTRSKLTK